MTFTSEGGSGEERRPCVWKRTWLTGVSISHCWSLPMGVTRVWLLLIYSLQVPRAEGYELLTQYQQVRLIFIEKVIAHFHLPDWQNYLETTGSRVLSYTRIKRITGHNPDTWVQQLGIFSTFLWIKQFSSKESIRNIHKCAQGWMTKVFIIVLFVIGKYIEAIRMSKIKEPKELWSCDAAMLWGTYHCQK